MKRLILQLLVKGSIVVLPLVVTAWLLWSALAWLNTMGAELLTLLHIPSFFPGFGMLIIISVLLTIGLLFQFNPVSWMYQYFEDMLMRFPLVKTLYGAVKDFTKMLDTQGQQKHPVVLLDITGMGQIVGFVTATQLPKPVKDSQNSEDELVAVYLPMSYMVGGYTLFIPRSRLTPGNWSFEDAMRFALTAGVSQSQARERMGMNLSKEKLSEIFSKKE